MRSASPRLLVAFAATLLGVATLTSCGGDEPQTQPSGVDSITPAPVSTSPSATQAATGIDGLPQVNFADITDCFGQLGDLDVTPIYHLTGRYLKDSTAKDFSPKSFGDGCNWDRGGTKIQVNTGFPATSDFLPDLEYDLDNQVLVDDTRGYSTAYTIDDYGVNYVAVSPDGRMLSCEFGQTLLGGDEDDSDVKVTPEEMIAPVGEVCEDVLTLLATDELPLSASETNFASDLPEIPFRFVLVPIDTCDVFDALDASELLGVDNTPQYSMNDDVTLRCEFLGENPEDSGDRIQIDLERLEDPSGTAMDSRPFKTVDGWDSAVVEVFETEDYDDAGSVQLKAASSDFYRFVCRYVGPAATGNESRKKLMDEVSDRTAETTNFCTRAIDLIVAR